MGVASGWNQWAWLKCIGVVSGCCSVVRRYIYRYPHNNYYFPLLHSFFLAAAHASLYIILYIYYIFFHSFHFKSWSLTAFFVLIIYTLICFCS